MRLAVFGTGSFAVPTLRAIADHVVVVVSQPARPSGRGLQRRPSPVHQAAQELGLRTETPEKSRSPEFVELLRSLDLDALVVASYGQILSEAVLTSAVRGGINLHGSLLPAYRGAAPIQRSILAGDRETGVSLMQMDRGMDTGDVIAAEPLAIDPDETYGALQDRLAELAASLASQWMPTIVAGNYPKIPQDSTRATLAPKVDKAEADLDVQRHARTEYNRFRAFTPNPGATLHTCHGMVKISKAQYDERSGPPGTALATSPLCVVAFTGGSIALVEVQPEGKKRMSGRDFANGLRMRPGDVVVRNKIHESSPA